MELYTARPEAFTVICADELGLVIPRTFPPAPGWSPGGHRVKAPVTMCAPSRNSQHYQEFLQLTEHANPDDALTARITQAEQQAADLRIQLADRDDELAAARAANRERERLREWMQAVPPPPDPDSREPAPRVSS